MDGRRRRSLSTLVISFLSPSPSPSLSFCLRLLPVCSWFSSIFAPCFLLLASRSPRCSPPKTCCSFPVSVIRCGCVLLPLSRVELPSAAAAVAGPHSFPSADSFATKFCQASSLTLKKSIVLTCVKRSETRQASAKRERQENRTIGASDDSSFYAHSAALTASVCSPFLTNTSRKLFAGMSLTLCSANPCLAPSAATSASMSRRP